MSASGARQARGIWLIPIAIGGVFAWPIASLAGLLWSRWLRPLSASGRIGYSLLLASLTIAPFVLAYLSATYQPLLPDRVWQVGLYLFGFAVWLTLHGKVIETPSRSVPKAILVASGSALLVGPAVSSGGLVLVFLPLWACIGWNILGWSLGGAVPPPDIAGVGLATSLPAFLGLLIVQWPKRRPIIMQGEPAHEVRSTLN
jgi:hypothetical protein